MKFYKNTNLKDIPGEIWVDAFGFDGIYEVSNLGRIKSIGRFVPIRNGQRWVKTRIKKQSLSKDGRLSCCFNVNNKHITINIPELIYQSFNTDVSWDKSKYCVIHINKVKDDNRLCNLKIETISKSHSINFKKGLLSHLIENNKKKKEYRLSLKEKTCKKCDKTKNVNCFEKHRYVCIPCRKIERSEYYYSTIKHTKTL